jgi:hypothetical protein
MMRLEMWSTWDEVMGDTVVTEVSGCRRRVSKTSNSNMPRARGCLEVRSYGYGTSDPYAQGLLVGFASRKNPFRPTSVSIRAQDPAVQGPANVRMLLLEM